MKTNRIMASATIIASLLGVSSSAFASSHREAPAIAQDQYADNTDVYVFISPTNPDNIVFVANYVPLLLPSSGPNFYRFADSVLYEIKIDNDGDARADVSYQFTFNTNVARPTTFLYNDGAITSARPSATEGGLNVGQTYSVRRVDLDSGAGTDVVTNATTAPWYVGSRSFPSSGEMTSDQAYAAVANSAIGDVAGGGKVFAGPRDEPFFVDLHVFDLLGVGGAQTTNGVNVMSLVLEVPITQVVAGGTRPAADADPADRILGVYASASRRQVRILRRGRAEDNHGQYVQVSRLAWPLVNEAVIPLSHKDAFNRSDPAGDVGAFGSFLLQPQLPGLLNGVLGLDCSDNSAEENDTEILAGVNGREYLLPLLAGAASNGGAYDSSLAIADLIRINVAAGQTFDTQNNNVLPELAALDQAFPNGRQLADDVTLIVLTSACDNPLDGVASVVDDGVAANDKAFLSTFPYVPAPASGNPAP